jgi:hypothetical protein
MYTIYKITNTVNNYIYIGKTNKDKLSYRLTEHYCHARRTTSKSKLYVDMKKQPKSDFRINTIIDNLDKQDAKSHENY